MILVFVTGRGLESVSSLFSEQGIPVPDYIIADVGSTIVFGKDLKPVEPIQSDIRSRWPGSLEILDALKGVDDLRYQPVPQRGRCSFWVHSRSTIDQVRKKLAHLECDLVYSANKFLDILPKGVNKGSTLKKLVGIKQWNTEEILVAGDTLNDLSLFECGYKSVIPANAEPALLEKLVLANKLPLSSQQPNNGNRSPVNPHSDSLSHSISHSFSPLPPFPAFYFAAGEGAAGILEGLAHFQLFPGKRTQQSDHYFPG